MKKCKRLYQQARRIPPGVALEMARCAERDEERNFFAYIADMNLQRKQWKFINSEEEYYKQPKE